MAIIKCKMCGGDIELDADKTFGTCEFCGSTMTFPKVDDEQRAAAFNRGNHFRCIGEFDKALAVYERIVRDNDADAEAHWCCALCRFGIEYVEDPATYEYLPTCHRASFDSFLEDVDYLAAVEHSEGITKRQYQKDAAKIAEVQRGILATSQNEEPFDVFICYKESDENGARTRDSLMAQDVYYQLTDQGYRVFFARITLEDVVGKQYEPYIFAALNSAKVMIAIGTKPEYLNAVWVKNEWSRFLAMMKKDRHKILLPCYKDMDPYDMPEQLSVLQSYDMSKIGFIQDLTRGIDKILSQSKVVAAPVEPDAPATVVSSVDSLLKRGWMALEDSNWDEAAKAFDQVLDRNPESARARLGNYMAVKRIRDVAEAKQEYETLFFNTKNSGEVKRIRTLADAELTAWFQKLDAEVCEQKRQEQEHLKRQTVKLKSIREKLKNVQGFISAGSSHTVGLKADGTTVATKFIEKEARDLGKCHVSDWRDIVSVSAGYSHTVGVKADGTVVTTACPHGSYEGQCEVSHWKDIVAVSAANSHTVGLKADGTVVATKYIGKYGYTDQCEVSDWKDIVAVSAAYSHTVGLKADGTVVATKYTCVDDCGQCEVSDWKDIVAVSAGLRHTVGLKADGTVVATKYRGEYYRGQCEVADWEDIVAISAGRRHTVGLKADGTVVAVGDNGQGQCNVSDWKDIVSVSAGEAHTVGLKADGTVVAAGSNNNGQCEVSDWKLFREYEKIEAEQRMERERLEQEILELEQQIPRLEAIRLKQKTVQGFISAGSAHTVGLKADGTVVATKHTGEYYRGQCEVSDWKDIVTVGAGAAYTVGLKADGTVVATKYTGRDYGYQCEVSRWKDIVAISAGRRHTVGLKADGTVNAVGWNDTNECNVSDWKDIVAISAGSAHTVGLKADGTVVAAGSNNKGQCEVSHWKDIVAVSAEDYHTVGLKADGTVVATIYHGSFYSGQCEVSHWKDIVAISAGRRHTVGLKADGTVVAVGDNGQGQCEVSDWKDIVAVSAGEVHTVGLKADGTVVAAGSNNNGQGAVSDWKLFQSADTLAQERKAAEQQRMAAAAREKQQAAWRASCKCQHCGGKLKGILSKKCARCGKPKDY